MAFIISLTINFNDRLSVPVGETQLNQLKYICVKTKNMSVQQSSPVFQSNSPVQWIDTPDSSTSC